MRAHHPLTRVSPCRAHEQVVTAKIEKIQAATDSLSLRNSLVCQTPAIPDPGDSADGFALSDISFSINGQPNEFSNSVPYRYSSQQVLVPF